MEFVAAVAQLDALVATLERDGDERALLLLELVDAVHRPALERLAAGDAEHPVVRALLAMYDLAGVDDRVLVEEALDDVRPYIESHGGEVELVDVREDGAVHVRLGGACHGCAGSALTLRRGVEAALREHWPGFRELVAEEPAPAGLPMAAEAGAVALPVLGPAASLPLAGDGGRGAASLRRPVFVALDEEPPEGAVGAAEVDGVALLLARVDGETYAFRDGCPVDGRSLAGARLTGHVLVCPWHNCAYDARTGRRVDGEAGPGLTVVPVAERDGAVQVAVNVA